MSHYSSFARGHRFTWQLITGIVLLSLCLAILQPGIAVAQSSPPPIDLMLILDNSCSMFEPGNQLCGQYAYGSDPEYLRLIGAALFAARMAFGQSQPQDRIGAISMAGDSTVVFPLNPIESSRNSLAAAVDNPKPGMTTPVVGALRLAYEQLRKDQRSGNKPVIVLLTDGVPTPSEGQSFDDIAAVVKGNAQIPLYILLLQNQKSDSSVPPGIVKEYNAYIGRWQEFQGRMANVRVYLVPDKDQLLQVYYRVMSDITAQPDRERLQGLKAGETKEFYVSRFARRIYFTVIHQDKRQRGHIEIYDKSGQLLVKDVPGVDVFVGQDNQVEVYSAYGPRLQGQTDGTWKVKSIDANVFFNVEVNGSYQWKLLAPQTKAGALPGVLQTSDAVRSDDPNWKLQFMLVDDQDKALLDKQIISGKVIAPDGQESDLKVPGNLGPDKDGKYDLPVRLADYSSIQQGLFQVNLESHDPKQPAPAQAIAALRLLVEADPNAPLAAVATPATTVAPITPKVATVTPTPTRAAIPRTVTPTPPCNGVRVGDVCLSTDMMVFLGILGALGLAAAVYILLRILRKPPEGWVVVVADGNPSPAKSLKGKANGKFWGWWELSVGLGGDIKIRPKGYDGNVVGAGTMYGSPSSEPEVKVPGLSASAAASAAPTKGKGKKKPSAKSKPKTVFGRFVNDGGTTRFIQGAMKTTLTGDSVQTATFGNIQMRMSLKREKVSQ